MREYTKVERELDDNGKVVGVYKYWLEKDSEDSRPIIIAFKRVA